jgi:hypothetical protein
LVSWKASCLSRGACLRQSILPLSRSRHRVCSTLPSKAVTKICSAVNTGEECPAGKAVRQTRFFRASKRSGRPFERDTPEPFGPRNCGQSAAASAIGTRSQASQRTEVLSVHRCTACRHPRSRSSADTRACWRLFSYGRSRFKRPDVQRIRKRPISRSVGWRPSIDSATDRIRIVGAGARDVLPLGCSSWRAYRNPSLVSPVDALNPLSALLLTKYVVWPGRTPQSMRRALSFSIILPCPKTR